MRTRNYCVYFSTGEFIEIMPFVGRAERRRMIQLVRSRWDFPVSYTFRYDYK